MSESFLNIGYTSHSIRDNADGLSMMHHKNITPRTLLVRLLKHFRRQPVLSRDDIDSDATEFVSDSDYVRNLVNEIKTEQGWIIGRRD
jgi:hypothetical protein